MNLLIRLSQLAFLIRERTPPCKDDTNILKIIAMMQSLYEAGEDVKGFLDDSITAVPTKDDIAATLLPLSYTFRSTYDLDLANHYYTYRLLLCGMIQFFYDDLRCNDSTHMFSSSIDIAAVQQEDETNSRTIAMCIQYSHECPDAPCLPLRFKTALKHGYGSLNRIQVNMAADGRVQEATEAARLKQLCYQSVLRTIRLWGVGPEAGFSEEYFGAHYQAAVGGPPWQLEKYFDEDGSFKPGRHRRGHRRR